MSWTRRIQDLDPFARYWVIIGLKDRKIHTVMIVVDAADTSGKILELCACG